MTAPVIIVGIVLVAIGAFTGPLKELWKLVQPSSDRIFVQCQMGLMPSVVPSEGRIHVLLTSEIPKEMGGGGLPDYFATPGSQWKWRNDDLPAWAYRCDITNYSTDVLFDVSISAHLTFRVPVPVPGQEKSRAQGDVTLDRDWVFTVPKLDPSPATPYVFYVWNCCVPKFVQVALPTHVETRDGKRLPLVQPKGNLFQPLNPEPFL